MNTAINEVCTGWLHKNCYLVRGIFLVPEMGHFWLLGGILPHSEDFPQRFQGTVRAVYTWWWQKRKIIGRRTFLVRGGIQRCIILGDNHVGNYFVFRDLIPMSFFKSWLWNWKCAPQALYLVNFVEKLLQMGDGTWDEVRHEGKVESSILWYRLTVESGDSTFWAWEGSTQFLP